LEETLDMLKRQDPTLQVKSSETGQTLISGMGELHLEIIKNRLLRDFKLNVKFHKPQVSYRETVANVFAVTGEFYRVIVGVQIFARFTIRIAADTESAQFIEVLKEVATNASTAHLRTVSVNTLHGFAQGGGEIYNFSLMIVRVTL